MSLGTSLAIAGIWIGVGLSSIGAGEGVIMVAILGLVATIGLSNHDR